MALADGQLLDGKYVIKRRIADGGMSTVYLGVNERLGKEVAVKVLSRALVGADDVVERFEREARVVSRIHSPYVADVFDFGVLETGERFMVMEYLEGESLAAMIARDRTIPTRMLATIATQILEGLSAAHAVGVIHRDLKPENVIVTKRGKDLVVKLVDFGISKVLDGSATTSVVPAIRTTSAGAVLGTPLYMSPEQARGTTAIIDQRTDLYSLGVMMYEATAGEPPLKGENVNDLLFRVALDEPTPLTTRVPDVDPGFAAIVAKAMAKSVTDRYQSADEMIAALEEWRVQFTSLAPAAGALRDSATVAPVVIETRAAAMTTGIYAKARRYARALPAVGLVALLLPFAKGAITPASARPQVAAEPMLEPQSEPIMPATKLVPIASDPIIIERHIVVPQWTPPPKPKPKVEAAIADAGTSWEPIITVQASTAPTTTTPTVDAPVPVTDESAAASHPQEQDKEQRSAD